MQLRFAALAALVAAAAGQCTQRDADAWLPAINSDLTPWSRGISLELMLNATAYLRSLNTNTCQKAVVRIEGGEVSARWLDAPQNDTCAGGEVGPQLDILRAVARLTRLPDTIFLLHTRDLPDGDASAGQPAYPLFHYCRTSASRNVLVEGFAFAGVLTGDTENFWGGAVNRVRQELQKHPPPAWRDREDVLFTAWSNFGRAGPLTWHTMRLNERLRPDELVRDSLERAGAALGDPSVRINLPGSKRPMAEWARYKYLLFADGIACSQKLWEMLYTGSLLFVEQSGYGCLLRASLRPFVHYVPVYTTVPQELGEALAWARAHPIESERIAAAGLAWAKEFLTARSLGCRWHMLLGEYNRLLRFDTKLNIW